MRLAGCALNWYAIQWPSGANTDQLKAAPGVSANTVAFLSRTEYVQIADVLPFCSVNEKYWPSGDHESGTSERPLSGLVRRSAVPLPSARCHQIPRSPSRSDWKATHWLSEDQTG